MDTSLHQSVPHLARPKQEPASRQISEHETASRQLSEDASASRQLTEDASASRQLSEDESVSREVWEQEWGLRGLKLEGMVARRELEEMVARVVGSDGHNWLKYGQKQVQRSNATRCYYRCSRAKTSLRCSGKKTVDINCRYGSDPLSPHAIQVSYRCRLHNHPTPPISRPPSHPTVPIDGPTKRPTYRRTYRPLDRPMSHHVNLAASHGGVGFTAASMAVRLADLAAALTSPDGRSDADLNGRGADSAALWHSPCQKEQPSERNLLPAWDVSPVSPLPTRLQPSPRGLAGLIPVNGCSTDLNNAAAVHMQRSTIYEELRLLDLRSQMQGEDDGRRLYSEEEDPTDEIYSSLGAISPTNQDLQELREMSLRSTARHVALLPEFPDAGLIEEEQTAGGVVVGNGESLILDLHGDGEEGSVHGRSGTGMAAPMGHVLGASLSGSGAVFDAPLFQTQKEPLTQHTSLTGCCAVSDATGFQTQQDVMVLQQQRQQEKQQQQQPQQQQQQQQPQHQQQQQQQQPSKQTDQVTALLLFLVDSFVQSNSTGVKRPASAALGTLTANLPASLTAALPAPLRASLPSSLPAAPSAALSDSAACISQPLSATTFGTLRNVRKRPASAMDGPPPALRATDQASQIAMFPTTSECAMFGSLHQQQATSMLKPLIPAAVVAFLGGASTIRVSDFAAVGVRKELQSWLEGVA
ncbi:unnamed protein product [Closterium sp. Naga37s-1]|nr:unnamed protein product [Closterium sp. Naga37s-1]